VSPRRFEAKSVRCALKDKHLNRPGRFKTAGTVLAVFTVGKTVLQDGSSWSPPRKAFTLRRAAGPLVNGSRLPASAFPRILQPRLEGH